MPERTAYEPGTPSWVDLSTPDVEGAQRFYGGLFGWELEAAGAAEETGGYAFFTLRGRKVAGVGPLQAEDEPPSWTTYFSTDDAGRVAARAREAGASVVVEPMDVLDAGRLTILMHPAAGILGAWQPGRHIGAELVDEPGTLSWNELLTRDVDGAAAFLAAVFGLSAREQEYPGGRYTLLTLGETPVGGVIEMPEAIPESAPAFWQAYFAVQDTDAAAARAVELGGSVAMEPTEVPNVGRFAAITDPYGALFSVIANAGPVS
jgi:predicted enzyme related to lactoylglutathione lyase